MKRIFINLDCDGVLANFVEAACIAHDRPITHHKWDFYEDWGITSDQFWAKCSGYHFWTNIKTYAHAQELVNEIRRLCHEYDADLTISTAPALDPECIQAKLQWLNKHFGISSHDVILGPKKWIMAHSHSILIDDKPQNIYNYTLCGGHGIIFPQPWNISSRSKEMNDWRDVTAATLRILNSIVNL